MIIIKNTLPSLFDRGREKFVLPSVVFYQQLPVCDLHLEQRNSVAKVFQFTELSRLV